MDDNMTAVGGEIKPEKMEEKIPIWRTGAFAGEFGDAFISDTNLEGGHSAAAIKILLAVIDNISETSKDLGASGLSLFTATDMNKIRKICHDFEYCIEVDKYIRSASSAADSSSFTNLLTNVVARIRAMATNERLVFPGGWSTPSGGHAIMYIVERIGEDEFAWCVCNTGNGLGYHPSIDVDYPKKKFICAMRFDGVPLVRMASIEFWYMIFHLMTNPSENNKPEVVYEVLLPFLAGGSFHQRVQDKLHLCGNWETGQRSGTCYYRCILSALRYLMKSDGFSKRQQKQFFLKLRAGFLDFVERDLSDVEFALNLNGSDAFMIELACNQTGNSAAKLFEKSDDQLNPNQLAELDSQFIRIKNVVQAKLLANKAASVAELLPNDISSSCSFCPFSGFELLLDDNDRSLKRGTTAVGNTSLFIDLLQPTPRPTNVADLCSLLHWAVFICDEIRTKSNVTAASVGLNQVCSFIEHLFYDNVDIPDFLADIQLATYGGDSTVDEQSGSSTADGIGLSLPESDSAETSSMWKAWRISRSQQMMGLNALSKLSAHYVAAVKSLTTKDRALLASRSITHTVIFCVFDALLRLPSQGDVSPVSSLLRDFGAVISCELNGQTSVCQLFDRALVVRPEVAIVRNAVCRYLADMQGSFSKFIFDYKFQSDFSMVLGAECDTLEFIKHLREATNTTDKEAPKANTGRTRTIASRIAQLNDVESAFSWFASGWIDIAPEFAQYRDLNLMFRLMLQPNNMFRGDDSSSTIWLTHDAQPDIDFISTAQDRKSCVFTVFLAGEGINPSLRMVPTSPLEILLSELRYKEPLLTEDSILFIDTLPDFDRTLSPQEAEQFFSILLYPHVATPLILNFFAGDRIALLVNSDIQALVESVLFEPLTLGTKSDVIHAEAISTVPVKRTQDLVTNFGIFYDELKYSPELILIPLLKLIENALAISISGYKSSVVKLLLVLVRIALRAESFALHIAMKGKDLPTEIFQLHFILTSSVAKRINEWIKAALAAREIEHAVQFYAHIALIFGTSIEIAHREQGMAWIENDEFNHAVKKFLCACAFVNSWHNKDQNPVQKKPPLWYRSRSKPPEVKVNLPSEECPVQGVFYKMQKLRASIIAWSLKANQQKANVLLDAVATVGLQHPFHECAGWERVSVTPMYCSLTVGNDKHPYPPCSDWSQTISFPGASSINIYFDPRSATEKTNDYVTISYPGCMLKFDGPAGSTWPGSNGSAALNIPYDTFVVEFHSDRSGGDWGFALTAVAPICMATAQKLVTETDQSMLICQLALKECRNYESLALDFIRNKLEELKAMEAEELKKRRDCESLGNASPGLYQDCYGYVQINLQTSEVYINNRVNMPVPTEIAQHEDYRLLFQGFGNILCTLSSCDTNRQCIQIIDPEGKFGAYEIQAWTPLKPYGSRGSGRGTMLKEESEEIVDNGRCTAFNMPVPVGDRLEFCGKTFSRYSKGYSWISEIFEQLDYVGDDDLVSIWFSDSCRTADHLTGDGVLLVQMQCSPGGRDLSDIEGHPGAWFEVQAISDLKALLVYALIDSGRKFQRQLVYTTEAKFAFKTLERNADKLENPRHRLLVNEAGHIYDGFKDAKDRITARPGVGTRQFATVFSLIIRRSRLDLISHETTQLKLHERIFCWKTGIVDLVAEEDVLEEMIPRRCLEGLIPESLLEKFQFWRTGSRLIRGYCYAESPSASSHFASESILLVAEPESSTATVHRLLQGQRTLTLLNPLIQSRKIEDKDRSITSNATLQALVEIFTSVEVLSHILFWSQSTLVQDPESLHKFEITRIELPRLCTAFDIRKTGEEVEFAMADHDDLTLCFDVPKSIRKVYAGICNCIPLRNSINQYFLLIPSFGLIQPRIKACPFMTTIVYDRTNDWYSNVQARYFLYPVHSSSKYLEMPSISAALYWTLLCFLHRKYTMVSSLIHTVCHTGLKLNAEQRYLLSLFPKSNSDTTKNYDCHPDAHACRLMLALMCRDCEENIGEASWSSKYWKVSVDLDGYYAKYAHVSQICRLTVDEESILLGLFPKAQRQEYLKLMSASICTGRDMELIFEGLSPQTIQDRVLSKNIRARTRELESWRDKCRPSTGPSAKPKSSGFYGRPKGELYYRRPDENIFGSQSIQTLDTFWKCYEHQRTLAGSLSYLGFAFLYELLSGQVILSLSHEIETSFMDGSIPSNSISVNDRGSSNTIAEDPSSMLLEQHMAIASQLKDLGLCDDWTDTEICAFIDSNSSDAADINSLVEILFSDLAGAKARASAMLSSTRHTVSSFDVGNLVEVNIQNSGEWNYAVVKSTNLDSSVNVKFFDGEIYDSVPKDALRSISSEHLENISNFRALGLFDDLDDAELFVYVLLSNEIGQDALLDELMTNQSMVHERIKKRLRELAEKQSAARKLLSIPRRYPSSWILVKLIAESLYIVDNGSNHKQISLLLALVGLIENNKDPRVPLFPFEQFTEELDSQEGLQSQQCSGFFYQALSKAVEVLHNFQQISSGQVSTPLQFPCRATVRGSDLFVRPELSDSNCSTREIIRPLLSILDGLTTDEAQLLRILECSADELQAFITTPLQGLRSFSSIEFLRSHVKLLDKLPFDISRHPCCQLDHNADTMIARIVQDLRESSATAIDRKYPQFSFINFSDPGIAQIEITSQFQIIKSELEELMRNDNLLVVQGIQNIELLLNICPKTEDSFEKVRFRFLLNSGRRSRITFEMYAASLASSRQFEDLKKINPFVSENLCQFLNAAVFVIMMRFVRLRQAAACLDKVRKLIEISQAIDSCLGCGKEQDILAKLHHVLHHQTIELANEMTKKRYCIDQSSEHLVSADPRFLLFEFITGFLLRRRQVELIRDFTTAHAEGRSSVHQMIMGAGKTQIIAPILSLMLADGINLVTIVCPGPLLPQSRTQLRSRFSNILPKKILTMTFERSSKESNDLQSLEKLLNQLDEARRRGSIVISTPQSVKSLFLKYIDFQQQVKNAPGLVRACPSDLDSATLDKLNPIVENLKAAQKMAEVLKKILGLWSKGVALLDEVDLLLHPLKSELNFPIGATEMLPLLPQRFELPIHLLDAFFSRKNKGLSKPDMDLWTQIHDIIEDGKDNFMFQSIPHLVLLNETYYLQFLRKPLAQWAASWLDGQLMIQTDLCAASTVLGLAHDVLLPYIVDYIHCSNGSPKGELSAKFVNRYLCTESIQLVNLARQWVWVYLPHVLSKIHRVSFGLIGDDDIQRWIDQEIEAAGGDPAAASQVVVSKSRRLLAVPFVGKDVPSRSSEFANPEVQIGLTILAYKLHGLRQQNIRELVSELKRTFLMEPGPFSDRPTRLLFEEWKSEADASNSERMISNVSATEVLPLEILQTADERQMKLITELLRVEGSVVTYYLTRFVFPNVLKCKSTKLQANGIDLGGDMLFGQRFGFSGTPSDLLPYELRPCHYEPGSEAEIIRTLSSPDILSVPASMAIGHNWDVDMLLTRVAQGDYSALIDSGALITGYTTEQVARKLLQYQHAHKANKKEVCVFLDERDLKMVVDVAGGPAYEIDRCGVPLEKRIVFYDHVHTTGIDIKHSLDAIAVCTLGKDLTLRDYSQGCWRMRGLGQGQRIHVLIIEEIAKLIEATQVTDNKLSDILAWLTVNSISSEKLQYMQLECQIAADAERRRAFQRLTTANATLEKCNQGKMLLPSIFFYPLDSASTNDLVRGMNEDAGNSFNTNKSKRNLHFGSWRTLAMSHQEAAYCSIDYLETSEAPTKACCTHFEHNRRVVMGSHWTCCGCRNPESTECLPPRDDDAPPRDFSEFSFRCRHPEIRSFVVGLVNMLNNYESVPVLDKSIFAGLLAELSAVAVDMPDVWDSLHGSLLVPMVNLTISELLIRENMRQYAEADGNDRAVKSIVKLTIVPINASESSEIEPPSEMSVIYDSTEKDKVQESIDRFIEKIGVNVSTSLYHIQDNILAESATDELDEIFLNIVPLDEAESAVTGADRSNNDREIVQEQEKERDEEREMEIFKVVHPEADRDPTTNRNWDVNLLQYGNTLMTDAGKRTFYRLKDFLLRLDSPKIPYPEYLLISECFAPFIHGGTGGRRLKNVNVIVHWLPNPSEGIMSVIVSLAEAETLRFLINRCESIRQLVWLHFIEPPTAGVAITKSIVEDEKSISSPNSPCRLLLPMTVSNGTGDIQREQTQKIAVQFARYFNNCLFFDDQAIIWLLDAFGSINKTSREQMFLATVMCRLRDQASWLDTPVAHVFNHENKDHLNRIIELISTIRRILGQEFDSFDGAFSHFAGKGSLELSSNDLLVGLQSLRHPIELTESEAVSITMYLSSSKTSSTRNVKSGPCISRSAFHKLRPSEFVPDAFCAPSKPIKLIRSSSSAAPEALDEDHHMNNNIFQGHSHGINPDGSDGADMRPVNEFYSHLHTPNIQSIGQLVVVPTPAAEASGQSAKVNISNDYCITTDSTQLLSVAPRGVKLDHDGGMWCFEVTVIAPGNCSIGFAEALPLNASYIGSLSRSTSNGLCASDIGLSGAKSVDFKHAQKGDVIRFYIDMSEIFSISYCHHQAGTSPIWHAEPTKAFNSRHFDKQRGIFPFISFDATFKFRINFGNLPFSTAIGNMPSGFHSIFHWIRTLQERQYARYRHSLGGYGVLANVSGRYNLDIVKLEQENCWEMKMATKSDRNGDSRFSTAFPTVFVDGVVLTQGKWYYEVTIRSNNVASQFGWADLDFVANNDGGQGVGDDKHSWAFDGDRKCLWHNQSISYGEFWKVGDVLGCACDLDVGQKTISFSLNGKWFEPVAFTGIQYSVGLAPALTTQARLSSISYYVNIGSSWKFAAPSSEYKPISEWIEYGKHFFTKQPVLGSPLLDELGGNELLPSAPMRMQRQVSAQPKISSSVELWYVPFVVKSGLEQITISPPPDANPGSISTRIAVCSTDEYSYPSIAADRICLSAGKWCYEVNLVSSPATAKCSFGFAEVSWSECNWSEMSGVGDDASSWGVFYKSGKAVYSRWNQECTSDSLSPHLTFSEDTCVGVNVAIAVDFDSGEMMLSINAEPPIVVFEGLLLSTLTPSFSAQGVAMRAGRRSDVLPRHEFDINLGDKPFFNPVFVDLGFRPVQCHLFDTIES